jgi:predicted negative regulator of RcsB-dependent stress response
LSPNKKKIIKIMAKNNVKAAPEAMEQQVTKTEAFFEKNKKAIIICVVAIIAIVVLAILAKNYYFEPRANEASTELAKSQDLFQQEQYDKALAGFQKVAADYSSTDAGNLAQLYIGLCQANLGKWQEAVNALESFSGKDDQMITPAAEGALGNAYANLNQLDKAVEHLKKAASMADNNSLSPTFLIQAGEILESQGKKDEALKLYQEVKEKYFNSMQYQTIDAYIERCK